MHRLTNGLLILMLIVVLAACGRSQAEPTPAPTAAPPVAPTESVTESVTEPSPTATDSASTAATVTPEATDLPAPATLLEIAAAAGNFQTLLGAVAATDLTEKLNSAGPFTIFAPTDLAFESLPDGALDNADDVNDILLHHVVQGELTAADLAAMETVTTLLGDELSITVESEQVLIGGVPVALADIEATNGVIHMIETLLLPPALAMTAEPGGAVAGVVGAAANAAQNAAGAVQEAAAEVGATAAGAADAATGAVANAAQNAAGAAQEAAAESGVTTESVTESAAGAVNAASGAVANAAQNATGAAQEAAERVQAAADAITPAETFTLEGPNLLAKAGDEADFAVLLAAIQAAGLSETLAADGPFTLFAPTQAAFNALPESVIETLLREPDGALKQVLLYHVTSGAVGPEALAALDGGTLATLNGAPLSVTVNETGDVMVDGAPISGAPLETGNGLIYAIDTLLIPATP